MERADIVCDCFDVTYGDIVDAVENGAKSLEEVQEATDAGNGCGACLDALEEMVTNLLKQ